MRNEEKILKHNSLRSGIIINFRFGLLGLIAVIGLILAFGATFRAAVGIYLGYKLLKLILRLLELFINLLVSVVLALLLITIISLLIF